MASSGSNGGHDPGHAGGQFGQSLTLNVGALTQAFAVAIQEATTPRNDSQVRGRRTVGTGSIGPPTDTPSHQCNSARSVLPSFLKRRRELSNPSTKKSQKTVIWDRDIVCLPSNKEQTTSSIPYPRGKYRQKLGDYGLIGKLRISSEMSEHEVEQEIRDVFATPMWNRSDFPFFYLQPTGAGSRTLTLPSVSHSFHWTLQQVAKLGSHKQPIYILAQEELYYLKSHDTDSSDEESTVDSPHGAKDPQCKDSMQSDDREETKEVASNQSMPCSSKTLYQDSAYQDYVDLIDLTGNTSSSSDDELPLPVVSFSSNATSASASLTFTEADVIKAKHSLLQHQLKVITGDDDEDVQRICVRRNSLVADTFRQFSKAKTNVSKRLKVVFIREASVDEGGPRREFFQLALKEIFVKSGLFAGWPHNVLPVPNIGAVVQNQFYVVGRLISTCLVQGGEAPVCFSRAAAEFLVYNEIRCNPCIFDIHDVIVQEKLLQVERTATVEDLRKVVSEMSFRYECGYQKPTDAMTLSDKHTLIKAVWLYHVFKKINAELSQLQKGMRETLMMDSFAATYPKELLLCLVSSTLFNVTPPFFLDTVIVKYSLAGRNSRTAEEAVILHWNDYILACADKDDDDLNISLSDILHFMTGSSRIPPAGFHEIPSILFTDDNCLPVASTCDLSLTLSRKYGLLTYEQFKDKMTFAIQNSFGYGVHNT